jgi:hypothetical protein
VNIKKEIQTMKVFKIYYETENGVEIKITLEKSRRSLKLPVTNTDLVIKIVDITEEFKNKVKGDLETIVEKTGNETIIKDIVSVLIAVKLY